MRKTRILLGMALLMVAVAPSALAQAEDDVILFRGGAWYGNISSNGFGALPGDTSLASYGAPWANPMVGDVNGDGFDDMVVVQDPENDGIGVWGWAAAHTVDTDADDVGELSSTLGTPPTSGFNWGPVADTGYTGLADITGDGIQDAIFVTAGFTWFATPSTTNGLGTGTTQGNIGYGTTTLNDQPILGDFNGDGMDDFGVWRQDTGGTFIKLTGGTVGSGVMGTGGTAGGTFGNSTWDLSLVGDINGDGRDDLVLVEKDAAANLMWQAAFGQTDGRLDASYQSNIAAFGLTNDVPMLADINGDGMDDLVVVRAETTFYAAFTEPGGILTTTADSSLAWGTTGDVPLFGQLNVISPPPIPSGPNVIVFLVDDLGLTDVQEHATYFPDGSPLFETPNMHRLAEQGMRFNHAYAQPLCSASRFSLLSGQYSAARYSMYMAIVPSAVPVPTLPTISAATQAYNYPTDRDHMPLGVETIAERLKEIGYATWHTGKWHLSPEPSGTNPNPPEDYYPDKQGFDKQLSVGGAGPSPGYFGPFTMPDMVDHDGNPAAGTSKDYIADHMATLVQGLLDDHLANDPTRPFFLYYPTYSVHYPHHAKRSRFDYYETKLAGLVDSKHQHPVMAAQVEGVDTELGALLDYMDANGLTDNTLFIFLSDNGGLSWESDNNLSYVFDDIGSDGIPDAPGVSSDGTYMKTVAPGISPDTRITNMSPRRGGKGALFEGGVRVPMIVRYPDGSVASNVASDEPVHLIDIYQTILDYTPAVPKAGYTLDGVSLKPVLEQTGSLAERDLFHYFPRDNTTYQVEEDSGGVYPGGTAVLDAPFKMIARYSTGHDAATVDYQLFRLDMDEGESTNVAGLYPSVVDEMRKQLDGFYTQTGAFVPTPNPAYNGTRFDSPEITIDYYLADAGLTPLSPDTFNLADPDSDGRNNQQEFLEQTGPNTLDAGVATVWIYDNDGSDELRFALPASADQSSFSILDQTGAVVFTPDSGLELEGQYGPFFVYQPSSPVPTPNPDNYTIVVADVPSAQSMTEFTVDYRDLLSGSVASSVDILGLNDSLLVDNGSGLAVVQEVTVTTAGVGGNIQQAGSHGLAVLGGGNSLWFDSWEEVDLTFALQTTEGTPVTNIQLEIIDVGARAVDSETMTFSSPSASATASWAAGPEDNGRPGFLSGTRELSSDEALNVQTGPWIAAMQRTQLSYVTFRIFGLSVDNTDTDGDLLPDEYETANGLNPSDPADGNADVDEDGLTRGQEYVAGTSDSDENDLFSLDIHAQDDGQGGTERVLSFNARDRRAYRLYKRSTLDESPVLMEDFGIISGNHSVQLTDACVGENEFYHLEAYLP